MKSKESAFLLRCIAYFFIIFSGCQKGADYYSRGVGIYPGNPAEDYSPELITDHENYRNLARLRSAYHSSSYDYNLTAQLVTDGIIISEMPDYISLSTSQGPLPKNEREWLLDHNSVTSVSLEGRDIFLQFEMSKNTDIPEITRINLNGSLTYDENKPGGWQFIFSGSNDGVTWDELGKVRGSGLPGQERPDPFARMRAGSERQGRDSTRRRRPNPFADFFAPPPGDSTVPGPSFSFQFRQPRAQRLIDQTFEFRQPVAYHFYRISLSAACAQSWNFGDWDFYNNETRLIMVPSHSFKSAWMSAGTGEEWVYVDLGVSSSFDHIKLYWVNKATEGIIQVSEDATTWNDLVPIHGNEELMDDIALDNPAKGRFVRILMTEAATGESYVLSEMEVFGNGGMVARPKTGPKISDNFMFLTGGNWKIQRASEVSATGESISQAGFENEDWVVATVPGTALVSYRNAGALPDPNFGDNQLMISESFFNSDFWYRNEFEIPSDFSGDRMFLNFNGINWKADIFVNGTKTGKIDGAFIRGKFDVTDLIIPGQKNAIAVLIRKNDHIGVVKEQTAISPDRNGGILGADNPTYHASIGWDWIPTIRGRNIGIWNDVYLHVTGAVTINDPFITTDLPLPDTTSADIRIEVTLRNHLDEEISGIFSGKYGDIEFEKEVRLNPSETVAVKLDPATHPALHFENPNLWWPKGYGVPNLYDVELLFKTDDGTVSDKKVLKSGVREMTFDEINQVLSIYINGRRFIGRGGNWGFPESNLNYRGREYDIAVAYHADMNFTMIRNWVGQTGDDELYEACDRHGIMIWQDFWLANPADGPNPYDPDMFMANAADIVKRIRNHPCIAIYVGRNEGNPPEVLDTALRAMIPKIHPGIHYISNSSFGVVSGGGPYRALPVRDYFLLYGWNRFHSERGMPNVMTFESLQQTLPESALWPQNSMWGLHDYCLEGAQGAASFNQIIEKGFGPAEDAKEFTELAQWINYNGYRGMFEGRSPMRKGLLLWMSHPAWPSMVWQTYDYYFEPTAAYFGCKKASEPVHIQWNPVYNDIEVVNYNGKDRFGLTAKAQLINMDGSVLWEKETGLDIIEDSTAKCFRLEFPESLSLVHFIKLTLTENAKTISENFYWRGLEDGNYQILNDLPVVQLNHSTQVKKSGDKWMLVTTLSNSSEHPALMIRLKVVGKNSGERILPVFYSDNYVSLMPGEEKVITMKLMDRDTRGEKPDVKISGFNLGP
ncbi:MAG: beta-glycosidase [Bacteroides sp. SM23_62_1]|nr:MAG: beta-glycosidase [Bacteroides sp. SM23_62_1]